MASESLFSIISGRKRALTGANSKRTEVVYSTLYKHLTRNDIKLPQCSTASDFPYGSVFNIEFSPSDSIALSVCSNRAIVGYDPRRVSTKPVKLVPLAHDDCVNCITFIDEVTFVTCSDDKTIRLWDLRQLKSPMYILNGHTDWVKNIEYDSRSKKLFSIAFHEGVREWNLNNLDQYNIRKPQNILFKLKDPVRMRIAPNGSKMFISLRQNKCFVIDKFDGNSIGMQQNLVESLLASKHKLPVDVDLNGMESNKPSILTMSGLQGSTSFRAVMSVSFHPCSDIVALRHLDVSNHHLQNELSTLFSLKVTDEDYKPFYSIHETSRSYLKYIDEFSPDNALDYIKECSFSPDGRVLASPYKDGVRLLAADLECTPLEVYYDDRSPHFKEHRTHCGDYEVLREVTGQDSAVLSCKFAHHDLLLGTGNLKGEVIFHKPRL